jgi:hypothetical protein
VALGEAYVNIRGNLKPLRNALARARKITLSAVKSIGRMAIRTAKWTAVGLIGVGAAAVKMAMDAQESENLFEVSMGKMAKATREWSDSMSKALGLNAYEVRRFVSTFNVMLTSLGIAPKKASVMSQRLTQLAYDMASFFNLKPAEAFQKLQSGITGEIEPLKRLGIIVNETAVKAFAMAKGIGATSGGLRENQKRLQLILREYRANIKAVKASKKTDEEKALAIDKMTFKLRDTVARLSEQKRELSETDKIMARFGLIMEATSKAQGDLERTMGSATNVLRRMTSQLKLAAIQFGIGLLGAVTKASAGISDFVTSSEDKIKNWGQVAGGKVLDAIAWFKDLYAIVNEKGWSEALAKIGVDIKQALKMTMEYLKPKAAEIGRIIGTAAYQAAKGGAKGVAAAAAAHPLVAAGAGAYLGGTIGGPPGAAVGGAVGLTGGLIMQNQRLLTDIQKSNEYARRLNEATRQGRLVGSM